ncbi:MAG: TonB-dependent receptor [Chitinophagaceae bacterium]|nr:TonB-dependent receptor [Chitinophagaceae bacterium]
MRKIKNLLTVVVLTTLSFVSYAQTATKISGIIKDVNEKTLESATISLLKAVDSSLVKVAIADKTGRYQFENIATGKYLVNVSATGHDAGFSSIVELKEGNGAIEVPVIVLQPATKNLGGVTVTSKKPLIEQKIDRMVINVEASVTNVGSSALEVLEKSPGITVDKDGNISLKGKQGVVVLIDGRPSYLSGPDLANMLRSMTSAQLDQIEIMTNPPAKFDAAGNAGVINIKTKKNKQFGYSGSVTGVYSQGRYPRTNESVNFNYRKGKVNLFTNLSYNYNKRYNNLDIQRNFRDKDTKQLLRYFDQEAKMQNEFRSYNAKVGMDYFASKNTTLGVVFNGYSNPGEFGNRNTTLISDANGLLINETRAIADFNQHWKNFSTNLNFRQVLDTSGQEITADVDYLTYSSTNNMELSNYYFDAFGNSISKSDTLLGSLPQEINIYSGKIDYLRPLKKGAKFEAGIKSSIVKTDNNANYDSIINKQIVHDYNRSNYFIYEENINAAYVNLSTPMGKKISAQLGLRVENTRAKGNQVTTGETFDRNYTQLFPTAYFQYKASEKHNLGLNYGRRIRRPNYQSLNPFIEFIDRYTYEQGNPNLKPQFSHNIELSHTFKGKLTTTLNYTKTTDIIQQVIEQNEDRNETYVKQANIASQRQYGIAVNSSNELTKWWTSNTYVNISNNHYEGIVNDNFVSLDATMFMLNSSQQFKFAKTWSAEVSGFYRSGGVEGVIVFKPMGMVSMGMGKQVLKNKGSVKLNVRDVFFTQRFKASSNYGNVDAAFQNQNDSRVVSLSFSYRFSKGKVNGGPKRKTGGAGDEQNRVGGGSGN